MGEKEQSTVASSQTPSKPGAYRHPHKSNESVTNTPSRWSFIDQEREEAKKEKGKALDDDNNNSVRDSSESRPYNQPYKKENSFQTPNKSYRPNYYVTSLPKRYLQGTTEMAYTSNIDSPNNFFVQLNSEENDLLEFAEKLDSYYNGLVGW